MLQQYPHRLWLAVAVAALCVSSAGHVDAQWLSQDPIMSALYQSSFYPGNTVYANGHSYVITYERTTATYNVDSPYSVLVVVPYCYGSSWANLNDLSYGSNTSVTVYADGGGTPSFTTVAPNTPTGGLCRRIFPEIITWYINQSQYAVSLAPTPSYKFKVHSNDVANITINVSVARTYVDSAGVRGFNALQTAIAGANAYTGLAAFWPQGPTSVGNLTWARGLDVTEPCVIVNGDGYFWVNAPASSSLSVWEQAPIMVSANATAGLDVMPYAVTEQ